MIKYNTLFISLIVLLLGCQEPSSNSKLTQEEVKELNEMSIYHLPSNWNTQDSEQISFNDLKGHPLVVVMIYTSCQTACPRLVADMRFIAEKVASKPKNKPKYVLVSIDPLNDSPEKLKEFAKENNMEGDQWLFLQGTEDGVRDFANILSVKYKKINPMDFSHSNIISVFDKEGVLQYQKEGLGLENDEIINQILKISEI